MEQKNVEPPLSSVRFPILGLQKNLKSRAYFFFKFLLAKSYLRNWNQISLPLVPLSTFYSEIVYSVLEGLVLVNQYLSALTSTCNGLPSLMKQYFTIQNRYISFWVPFKFQLTIDVTGSHQEVKNQIHPHYFLKNLFTLQKE